MTPWPPGFPRIPDEPWVDAPVEQLALKYDTVERHGWYRNLEPTLDQLEAYVEDDHVLIDYSGGTGILVDRYFERRPDGQTRFVIVDASPKFLRLAVEKLGGDPRVAFRWIEYRKDERRLWRLDEVLPDDFRADGLASTNAIHLYYDLDETLRSWWRCLRPGARAFVQSGNIRHPDLAPGQWIIDETVEAIHRAARALVAEEDRWTAYRDVGDLEAYDRLRAKYFLPVRPLAHYLDALTNAGFTIEAVDLHPIGAEVEEWYDFLAVYHEGVLGWVGGTKKIAGREPTAGAVRDRLEVLRAAMGRVFGGRAGFTCGWTYVTAVRA